MIENFISTKKIAFLFHQIHFPKINHFTFHRKKKYNNNMNLIFLKALIKTIEVLQNFEKMMKNRTYSIKILSSKISLYIFFRRMIYFMKHLLKTLLKALYAHKILIQLKNNKKKKI